MKNKKFTNDDYINKLEGYKLQKTPESPLMARCKFCSLLVSRKKNGFIGYFCSSCGGYNE